MNARGDAVVAWAIDGPSANQNSVMAASQPAGQSWTSPQLLATSAFIAADQAGISENGDVIVAWDSVAKSSEGRELDELSGFLCGDAE
jgi:hypothetical protein